MAETAIRESTLSGPNVAANIRHSFANTIKRDGFGIIVLILLVLFILGPISSVFMWAFADKWAYPSLIPTQWGVKWWSDTLERPDIIQAFPLSIGLSVTVTLLSALICLPAAYAFARIPFRGRQPLLLSFLATNAFPRFGLYVSIAVIFFRLNLVGTVPGVVLIQLVNTLLLMIWIPTAAFQGIDRSLEEAALDVGASRLRVFVQITLPLVLPALSAPLMLVFINTFSEAQGPLLIGLPSVETLPVLMYSFVT